MQLHGLIGLSLVLCAADSKKCDIGWQEHRGACYYSSAGEDRATFEGADGRCKAMGGSLVSVHWSGENDFVASLIDGMDALVSWIGLLNTNGTLLWTDKTNLTFVAFNNKADSEMNGCFVLSAGTTQPANTWISADCYHEQAFVCKKMKHRASFEHHEAKCINCTRRLPRQILLDPFESHFSDPYLVDHPLLRPVLQGVPGQIPLNELDGFHRLATNVLNRRMKQDFPEVYSTKFHIPNRQGGRAHYLNSLFARGKDDTGNLITDDDELVTTYETTTATQPDSFRENYKINQSVSTTPEVTPEPEFTSEFVITENSVQSKPIISSVKPSFNNVISARRQTIVFEESVTSPTVRTTVKPGSTSSLRTNNGCFKEDGDAFYKASCYHFIELTRSSVGVRHLCAIAMPKGEVVTIDDKGEDDFLSDHLSWFSSSIWLGLLHTSAQDSSSYKHYDGSNATYFNWANNEPATSVGDCVYRAAKGAAAGRSQWFADACTAKHAVLCEYPRQGHTPSPTLSHATETPFPCAAGWTHYRVTASCYKLMTYGGHTQRIAEMNCVQYGGHLVSIGSEAEESFIKRMSEVVTFKYTTFWTGLVLNETGGYVWLDSSPTTYLRWHSGQPESHHGRENCVSAYKVTMELSDSYCDAYFGFMCKSPQGMKADIQPQVTEAPPPFCPGPLGERGWTLFRQSCYKAFSETDVRPRSWSGARTECQKDGADLLSVADHQENSFILSQIHNMPDYLMWIGGSADFFDGYSWTDGSPFVFMNWKVGEPNNYQDQESCVALYPRTEAYWNDDNCGRAFGWICKTAVGASSPTLNATESPTGHCHTGWTNIGKKCAQLQEKPMTFKAARATCKSHLGDADLVSVHSELEHAHLSAMIGPIDSSVWIGMFYNDEFVWVDQSPVEYTNWAPGEPNNIRDRPPIRFHPLLRLPHTRSRHLDELYGFHFRNIFRRLANGIMQPRVSQLNFDGAERASRNTTTPLAAVGVLSRGRPRREDVGSDENCVEMYQKHQIMKWNNVVCTAPKPFICQKSLDPTLAKDHPPPACSYPYESYFNYSDSCYKYVGESQTWQQALEQCKSEGASLLSIESLSEQSYAFVTSMKGGFKAAWIGLNSIKTPEQYLWSDGFPVLYSNWGSDAPNVSDTNSRCVELSTGQDGAWFSRPCDEQKPFVCKYRDGTNYLSNGAVYGGCPKGNWMDFGGRSCYKVETEAHMTWSDANFKCNAESAQLVSIHSEMEMKFIALLSSTALSTLWTGLIRIGPDKEFQWSDGSPYDFMHWLPEEPNNPLEQCVEMVPSDRRWNDNQCSVLRGFVCKADKVEQPASTSAQSDGDPSSTLKQRHTDTMGVGGGGAAGIAITCVVVVAAAALVLHSYRGRTLAHRHTDRPDHVTSFDNALYDPNDASEYRLDVQRTETGVLARGVEEASLALIGENEQ